jgi:hypothetical protein
VPSWDRDLVQVPEALEHTAIIISDPSVTRVVMFLFAHVMAGILLGLVLAAIAGDRRVVAVCAVGAALPDLIDKPLGHILLKGSVDYGRIYFHGLTVLALLMLLGLLLFWYRRQILVLVLAVGVASHQILDGMWRHPVEWFWPFLGPLQRHSYPDSYLWDALWRQLTQPTEWIYFALITGLFIILYRDEAICIVRRFGRAAADLVDRPSDSRE